MKGKKHNTLQIILCCFDFYFEFIALEPFNPLFALTGRVIFPIHLKFNHVVITRSCCIHIHIIQNNKIYDFCLHDTDLFANDDDMKKSLCQTHEHCLCDAWFPFSYYLFDSILVFSRWKKKNCIHKQWHAPFEMKSQFAMGFFLFMSSQCLQTEFNERN